MKRFVMAGLVAAAALTSAGARADTFAQGSLIIPMDVDYQDAGMLKAFGLLDKLLRAGIPVAWVIKPTKQVVNAATGTFESDMTASGVDFKTGVAIVAHPYRGGPFVIDSSNASAASSIIRTWQKTNTTTAVHVATAAFSAPVSRHLSAAPRIAVLGDGNQSIAFTYLNAAGIPDENGLAWANASVDVLTPTAVGGTAGNPQDGALFSGPGGQPVFCEIMTMHWDVKSTDIPVVVPELQSFLKYPVHVNAECQAVNAIEGQPPAGGRADFVTTHGFQWPAPSQPSSVQFANSALPFAQMDGPFKTVGGSEPAYGLYPGSTYYNADIVMIRAAGQAFGVQDLWMTGYANGACDISEEGCNGIGKTSYLGGHQYNDAVPISSHPDTQGTRLFLNSLYEAGCVTWEGQPAVDVVKGAPDAVTSSSLTFTLDYDNLGYGPALNFQIVDPIPQGSTFVSATGGGVFSAGAVTWNLGNLGKNASGRVSLTVTLPSKGTYTNQASARWIVGLNVQTLQSNQTSTVWGDCVVDNDCASPLVCDPTTHACVQCTLASQQACTGIGVCIPGNRCGCAQDSDCGDSTSGRVCNAAGQCINGCRGVGTNGCANGQVCTSNNATIGGCVQSQCTTGSQCPLGYCVDGVCCDSACGGGDPNDCLACSVAAGAAANGTCSLRSNGASCNDGNLCSTDETCQSGSCVGVAFTCAPLDACHVAGVCNPATGACTNPYAVDGTSCNDGNACTLNDTCMSGVCTGVLLGCASPPSCQAPGVCKPTTGACSYAPADDGTPCSGGICVGSVCTPIDDGGSATGDTDGGSSDDVTVPDGGTADDGSIADDSSTTGAGGSSSGADDAGSMTGSAGASGSTAGDSASSTSSGAGGAMASADASDSMSTGAAGNVSTSSGAVGMGSGGSFGTMSSGAGGVVSSGSAGSKSGTGGVTSGDAGVSPGDSIVAGADGGCACRITETSKRSNSPAGLLLVGFGLVLARARRRGGRRAERRAD